MKIIYCKTLSEVPDHSEIIEDKPGWESLAVNNKKLDARTVYKYNGVYWVPKRSLTNNQNGANNDNAN